MELRKPECIGITMTSPTKGTFFYDGVGCYGDPFKGPWVEINNNGCVRKFETNEIPIGGYVWASRVAAKNYLKLPPPINDSFAKILDDLIDRVVDHNKISCEKIK